MKRIYSASFLHESNTFSSHISDLSWFKKRCWKTGDNVIKRFRGTKTEFGGFIDALDQEPDIELVPIIAAEATPSGPVAADVAKTVQQIVLKEVREAQQIDAVLLSMHGAMVTQESEDGEGDLLYAIRNLLGPEIPIFVTLDLHANITPRMIENANVMIPYATYPHIDKYECGYRTAHLLAQVLHGEKNPCMVVKKLPLLFPLIPTSSPAFLGIQEYITVSEADPDVICAAVVHGFISADITDCGASTIVITNGKAEKAQSICKELARKVWSRRDSLLQEYVPIDELAYLIDDSGSGPIVIADGPDNPGGGSYADGTLILKYMLENHFASGVVALIHDPESVDKCFSAGENNLVELTLGGKHDPVRLGPPIVCRAKVLKLTDGRYKNIGPMNEGLSMDLLGTALIDLDGIRVIVTKNPTQPYDFGLMYLHGIVPEEEQVIVLKSAVHFRAAYEKIAKRIIQLDYPGVCILSTNNIQLKRCRRPIFPMDKDTQFNGE